MTGLRTAAGSSPCTPMPGCRDSWVSRARTGPSPNAYMRVDTTQSPGQGITGATMQFHGTADEYQLAGASKLATLYNDATDGDDVPGRDPASRRYPRRAGGRVHVRPGPFGRVHPPGQPRVVGPGARRRGAHPLRRPVLRRVGERPAARLGRPQQGRDPAGRRAATPVREPGAPAGEHPDAAPALLVPPER